MPSPGEPFVIGVAGGTDAACRGSRGAFRGGLCDGDQKASIAGQSVAVTSRYTRAIRIDWLYAPLLRRAARSSRPLRRQLRQPASALFRRGVVDVVRPGALGDVL